MVRLEVQRIAAPAVEASADADEQSQPLFPMGPIHIIQRIPDDEGLDRHILHRVSRNQSFGVCVFVNVDDDRGITADVSLVR